MRITLSGTAGAGLPVPGCGCRVCRATVRPAAPTSLRVMGSKGGTITLTLEDKIKVVPGTDRSWLLWAPDHLTGPMPDEDHPFDVVFLGGRGPGLGYDVARLRGNGAIGPRTRIVLVNRGHDPGDHDPTRSRDALRLAAWHVETVPDGTMIDTRRPTWVTDPTPQRTLVLGPASSGKSEVAEELMAAEPSVTYLATGPRPGPDDDAWAARVASHRERRPAWWRTVESDDVAELLAAAEAPVLLDSLGTWLTGALDRAGAWDDASGWRERLAVEVDGLVEVWRRVPVPVVAVAEETGWGVVPETVAGGRFREELGRLTARLSAESERVLLVVAGQVVPLDGVPAPERISSWGRKA